MNRAQQALYEMKQTDELAMMDSPVHRFSALSKLMVTVIYIVTVMSFSKYDFGGVFMMALYPYLVFQLSGLSFKLCMYRMRYVIPLVAFVGIFNPFIDRTVMFQARFLSVTGGMISFVTLMIKGILCLCAAFLLSGTAPVDEICGALRRLHVPSVFVTVFLLAYRYMSVLMEEVAVMSDAYHLRAPRQKGIAFETWGSFLGQLLLRSMDRAQELYAAMQLRGYDGEFRQTGNTKDRSVSFVWFVVWTAVFLILRFVPVASLIGNLFVRQL